MNIEELIKFKQIARRLHTRGVISQNLCLMILGLKEPKYRVQSWMMRVSYAIAKFALRNTR